MTNRTTSADANQHSAAVGEFAPDDQTARIMEVYGSVCDVYRRAAVAMGRIPTFEVSAHSTLEVKIPHGNGESTEVHHIQ